MNKLDGRIVVITGAKGGLGTYVTKACLDAGATVIGVSRSISQDDFKHEQFHATPAELSGGTAAVALTQDIAARFGRVDALIHLVGGFAGGKPLAETDDKTFDRMIDLNLRSTFHIATAVIPQMRQQRSGRILAVGSRAATEASPLAAIYAASKAALVSMMRSIAAENRDACISANVVLPGTMDTPANRAADPNADFTKWVDPAQVAALLVHLASDAGAQINGAAIPVYGRDV